MPAFLKWFEQLRGLAALIVIGVLGVVGLLLGGVPLVRKAAFVLIAVVAAFAAFNEVKD